MFEFTGKLAESFLHEEINKSIIIKNAGNKPSIARLSESLLITWQYDIQEPAGQYTPTHLNELIFFERGQSVFINRDNGMIVKKEPVYYFIYQPYVVAYVFVNKPGILEVQCNNHQVQLEHINSLKFFYADYLVQVPYVEKCITCHSLIDGSLLWHVTYSEISGSDKVQLYSDIINDGNRLIFFLSDLEKVSGTFVLDIATGKIVHHTNAFGGNLVLHNGKVYVANPTSIGIMDANTFATQIVSLAELLQPDKIKLAWNIFAVQNNYIYFTDAYKSAAGVLDLQAKKILWYKDLETSCPRIGKIIALQVHSNTLYLSAADHGLYVFKEI